MTSCRNGRYTDRLRPLFPPADLKEASDDERPERGMMGVQPKIIGLLEEVGAMHGLHKDKERSLLHGSTNSILYSSQ